MESEALVTQQNANAVYRRMDNPMEAIKEMGQMFASSGMFGCTKLEQGQVLALACLIEGKSPFELMRNYHIIGGNLTMKSVAVLAEFMKTGGNVVWHSALSDGEQASATFVMGGNELPKATYTIADAQREGLVTGPNKHNWNARPADMLRARLITKAVRMLAPSVIMGISEDSDPAPLNIVPGPGLLGPSERRIPPAGFIAGGTSTDSGGSDVIAEAPPTVKELLEAHKEITVEQAIIFLRSVKWLEENEGIDDLGTANQKRILKGWDTFCMKVKVHTEQIRDANANA